MPARERHAASFTVLPPTPHRRRRSMRPSSSTRRSPSTPRATPTSAWPPARIPPVSASGLARVDASGVGAWLSASFAAGDAGMAEVAMNSARLAGRHDGLRRGEHRGGPRRRRRAISSPGQRDLRREGAGTPSRSVKRNTSRSATVWSIAEAARWRTCTSASSVRNAQRARLAAPLRCGAQLRRRRAGRLRLGHDALGGAGSDGAVVRRPVELPADDEVQQLCRRRQWRSNRIAVIDRHATQTDSSANAELEVLAILGPTFEAGTSRAQ